MAQAATEIVASPIAKVPRLPALPSWRILLWVGWLTLAGAVIAAGYLAYTGNVATSSYQIQRLRAERDTWHVRNEQLRVELAKVRSLSWVEHEAVSRLEMRKPANVTFVRIEPPAVETASNTQRTGAAR